MSSATNKHHPAILASYTVARFPPTAMAQLIRSGNADLRERGTFTGNTWRTKRLELDAQHLSLINLNSTKQLRISLSDITELERTDLANHSLAVKAGGRRYNISFASDSELYDWQDDIYRHCPLGNYSKPFDFVHKAHLGSDTVTGTFTDPNILPIYAEIIGAQPPVARSASGIAIAPRSRPPSGVPLAAITKGVLPTPITTAPIPSVLEGTFLIKQPGLLSGWRWRQRWLSLTSNELTIHRGKTKGTSISYTIALPTISLVEPDEKRQHGLVIEYGQSPSAFAIECLCIIFPSGTEMYTWRDALYARSGLSAPISGPTNFVHKLHVGFDSVSGAFTGLPSEWAALVGPPSPPNSAPATSTSMERKARRQSRRRSAPLVEPISS